MNNNSSSTNNYYKQVWTQENGQGFQFWKGVNFNKFPYQYQESVFREYIRNNLSGIKSVLEVGAGTQRMTKIVLDELLSQIERYDAVDLKIRGSVSPIVSTHNFDITTQDFDENFRGNQYDLILCSEILMHIKPEDIDRVIKTLSRLLNPRGNIINIDWNFGNIGSTEWCFIHDYDSLYRKYGLKLIDRKDMKGIYQSLFHYRR